MSPCSISTKGNWAEANNLHIIEQEIKKKERKKKHPDEPALKGRYLH